MRLAAGLRGSPPGNLETDLPSHEDTPKKHAFLVFHSVEEVPLVRPQ